MKSPEEIQQLAKELAPLLVKPQLIRRGDLWRHVGSKKIADRLVKHKWLRPILDEHNQVMFLPTAISKAVSRMSLETLPQ